MKFLVNTGYLSLLFLIGFQGYGHAQSFDYITKLLQCETARLNLIKDVSQPWVDKDPKSLDWISENRCEVVIQWSERKPFKVCNYFYATELGLKNTIHSYVSCE